MINLDRQFRKVVNSSLKNLSIEEFKPIALGIWYEGYTPNLNDMNLDELRKAGYLIDRLMRFNCVSDRRKLELMELTKKARNTLKQESKTIPFSTNIEPLAKKWDLSEDIAFIIQALLKYQTRHYIHTS